MHIVYNCHSGTAPKCSLTYRANGEKGNIMELSCWRSDLQITSRETALEFYRCIRQVHLIWVDRDTFIRVEPNNQISRIPSSSVKDGSAWMYPGLYDPYGNIAYKWRKYINAWLRGDF